MHRSARSPASFRLLYQAVFAGLGWMLNIAHLSGQPSSSIATAVELPQGTLISQTVWLEAPVEACAAYYESFKDRTWTLELSSRVDFATGLASTTLPAPLQRALLQPELWHQVDAETFIISPPPALLAALSRRERAELYYIVAHWPGNQPERWPLVFADEAAFQRLLEQGVAPALVERARALAYPFRGGFALSDFSVLAHEFPHRDQLIGFLQAASAVRSTIPRLRLSTASKISDLLNYWTAERQNPYAAPLLEALHEADLPDGVDLVSILPGSPRVLSYDLDPNEVPRNLSLNSFLVSAHLAQPPPPISQLDQIFVWLHESFTPTAPPLRYGDLLILSYPEDEIVAYACAYVVNDLVFARDPVGLGLWRFMTLTELQQRNPHFAAASFQPYRLRAHRAPVSAP